ncbi:MAG: DUF4157 domain-containing protein [Saprospiraceae bacterium]
MEKENLVRTDTAMVESNNEIGSAINAPSFNLQISSITQHPTQLKTDEDKQENSKEDFSTLNYDTGDAVPTENNNQSSQLAQAAPPVFQLKSSSPSGMPDETLNKMSASFGSDFSDVNIHSDSKRATDAGALAYTQGNDIHFAPGQYDPSSQSGQELLGHELTHVQQQREGRVQANNEVNGLPLNDDKGLEQEADEMGSKVSQRKEVGHELAGQRVFHSTSTAIQRKQLHSVTSNTIQRDPTTADKKKELKMNTASFGSHFDLSIKVNGPNSGSMEVKINVKINFINFSMDIFKERTKGQDDAIASFDDPKKFKKLAAKLTKEDKEWSDAQKTKFIADYQQVVQKTWGSENTKLMFELNNNDYEKHKLAAIFKINVIPDASSETPHKVINSVKMAASLPRLRSFVGDEEATFDSRDVSDDEKRKKKVKVLSDQVGTFENAQSAPNSSVESNIDRVAGRVNQKLEAEFKDKCPDLIGFAIGRASKNGSAKFNEKLSNDRANTVAKGLNEKTKSQIKFEPFAFGQQDAKNEAEYQRVEVTVKTGAEKELSQNVAAHETGHIMGLDDQYRDEDTKGASNKSLGGKNKDYDKIKEIIGEDEAEKSKIENNEDNVMNKGSKVSKGNYVYILEKLNNASTSVDPVAKWVITNS